MSLSRRTFLETLVAGTAALVTAPVSRLFAQGGVPRLQAGNPLFIPPLLTGETLTAAPSTREFWSGVQTPVLGLNGTTPGPTIRLRRGETFSTRLVNNIDESLILHWHGVFAPAAMDGHPKYAIQPGQTFDYSFGVSQQAGTFFYHSHTHGKTARQVYMGLAGLFIIDDDEQDALGLPTGEFDVPLLLQDRRFDAQKNLLYNLEDSMHMEGYLGDTALINGTIDAELTVKRALYRFRLVNGSNARIYKIVVGNNHPFIMIASDGGLLEKPVSMTSLFLSPGERAEVLVDFSAFAPGDVVHLNSAAWVGGSVSPTTQGSALHLMQFIVGEATGAVPAVPASLSVIPPIQVEPEQTDRTFEFSMVGMVSYVNKQTYDMMRIDAEVPYHAVHVWELSGRSNAAHPIHIHGVQFQILSRNGNTAIAEHERGWKDTVLLAAWEKVRVAIQFDQHDGEFLLHCHNLEHEDEGMMANFMITSTNSVDPVEPDTLSVFPNPASEVATVTYPAKDFERILTIVDTTGRNLLSLPLVRRSTARPVDVRSLAPGRYFCRIDGQILPLAIVR